MLNKNTLSKLRVFKASLAFIICALLISLSCGKRKPPQPPEEAVVQRTVVTGNQQGSVVILHWKLPVQNAAANSVLNISRVDVYRLAEPLTAPMSLSEEEFASRSTLISSQPISAEDFRRSELTFTDNLDLSGQNARLRYAIRFVNSSGQKASFSNFLLIEPATRVAGSPIFLSGRIFEERIELVWKSPTENVDGSQPANIIGYNVYRINSEAASPEILNNNPIKDTNFSDRLFNFGANYKYFVRTVSLGANGEPVESLNSNTIELEPKDIFAPSAPSAITIAAAPNNLSIFFAVNPEKDVVGYRIYRSTDPNRDLSEWSLLTSELLVTNTFQDKSVESGKTYFYYITAIDSSGNISARSVVVSETAP